MIVMDLRDALQAQMNSTIMLMRASGYSEQDILDCTSQARAALADDLRAPSPSANDMHGCTCEACQAMDRQLGSDTSSVAGTEREALVGRLEKSYWSENQYGQRVEYSCASVQDCKTAAELLRRTVAETGEPVEREVSELVAYFRPGRIDQGVASRGEIIDEMASLIRRDTGILNGCADAAARSIAEMLTRAALAQPATAGEP